MTAPSVVQVELGSAVPATTDAVYPAGSGGSTVDALVTAASTVIDGSVIGPRLCTRA